MVSGGPVANAPVSPPSRSSWQFVNAGTDTREVESSSIRPQASGRTNEGERRRRERCTAITEGPAGVESADEAEKAIAARSEA